MEDDLDSRIDEWLKWGPHELKARHKLHEALIDLINDPEINSSGLCAEFLDLILKLDPAGTEAETLNDLIEPLTKYLQKLQARRGATAMLANAPKQADKIDVRDCWERWQKEPDRYKGKAAFAKDMREKYPNLESQAVIERWCRTWERET